MQPQQLGALQKTREKDFGVLVLPPGSGKTLIGLEIIVEKRQPALIIVHRKHLFDQWVDRIQNFLKIPKKEIGQIGNQRYRIGKEVTIAMIQSLARIDNTGEILESFGTIIVDECHHIPAKSFRETIVKLNSYYLYGLTATAKRKNNDQKLIFVYIGNILYQVDQHEDLKKRNITAEINIRETNLYEPFDYKTDKYETITIHGKDSESTRKSKMEQIKLGHFKIVISTGQYFGEGIDIKKLECLFIVYPFAFEGKLIQYIGRIQRSESPPVIFDYRDARIDYFEKMFKKRNRYYKKLLK